MVAPPTLLCLLLLALLCVDSSLLLLCCAKGVGNFGLVSAPTGIARFSTLQHGGGGMSNVAPLPSVSGFVASGAVGAASPPSSFSRQVSRLPAGGGAGSGSGAGAGAAGGDWRALVSVEERIVIRRKLRDSYLKHCPTYQELIDTATAVDEELLFACSTNRIDFFKSSIDWDTRIQIKCQQLKTGGAGGAAAVTAAAAAAAANSNGHGGMGAKKRSFEDAAAGSNLSASSTSLLSDIGFNNSDLLGVGSSNSNSSGNNGALHLAPPAPATAAAAAAASASSSLFPAASLRGATLPAASLPAASLPAKDMANLLVAVGTATESAAQPNKKQRS